MPRRRPLLPALAALAALALVPSTAAAQSSGLSTDARYENGPTGRYLVGGQWLLRMDPKFDGQRQGFQSQTSTDGWTPISVPHAWNATDESETSFMGTVGWYRKDFKLPSGNRRFSWVMRFESVNYRSRIYLNGKLIGQNRGAYLPFEIRLPPSVLKRGGATNRLVVRVDSRRFSTDFPPSGLSVTGAPTGGWWNYGGLLREVYLRRIDGIDFSTAVVRPDLPCGTCDASLTYRATLRNYGERARRVTVRGKLGSRTINVGTVTVGPKKFATLQRRVGVRNPRVWDVGKPSLYDTTLTATSGGRTLQRFRNRTGIRSIKVANGELFLNGKRLNYRGFGLHEDSKDRGFAIDNATRDQQIAWAQEAGATLLRSHYPLHPHYYERLDELGMLAWVEVPVYAVKTQYLKQALVRRLAARELESAVLTNQNHPSIITWSIGNELSARPGPVQGSYIAEAVRRAKAIDPSRPVGYAVAGYPAAGCQPEYKPLDVIGINEYFGWYPGPNGQIADRELLSDYLDSVRACYGDKAIVITEFGAEANRDGPVEEKGTYLHQQDFVNYHLGVYASKPWLSGAVWWGLQEFRVRPGWEGGNPRPEPPIHQKGVVRFDGSKKPAFFDLQRLFKATTQVAAR
ncbi:glycoside hydrolase family 2 protein [Conexibacter sp. SYSU D00693]|uniref:glycoside hydrolase family 2 protein n=1 Tax=Conexibacter sp. SYSU D00693 TaxID=2812560 RepID=UPI00196A4872|nr:glycoside hydrolase family 2 TIM barrel-domain containing protein [Conexibacter sp. SYSU D00693]